MRGLIPAHTGKTFGRRPRLQRCWAHPHSRGENGTISRCVGTGLGSSPLTRGKLVRPQRWSRGRRLIPAHAGKTYGLEARQRHRRAHPRSRGENFYRLRPDRIGRGSSPLTRGKPSSCPSSPTRQRIIPAHAGKTLRTTRPCFLQVGSSPLTRGKLCRLDRAESEGRLIPAHAGKTFPRVELNHHETAHPRSRGENYAWCGAFQVWGGSSPLTRGKLVGGGPGLPACGLIPAHAGKTRHRAARA